MQTLKILLYFMNFTSNLTYLFLQPTTLLIPAILMLGTHGAFRKDFSKLRRYLKWWALSLIPVIILLITQGWLNEWFLKEAGM